MFDLVTLFAQLADIAELLDIVMVKLPLVFVIWMMCTGGTIGSFLNVVVYRMPAGLSISHPPSHCPKCKTPIRVWDNVPIFGWILLGGKCRSCKLPIAARYPMVEATVAILFGVVALVTVYRTHETGEVLMSFARFIYYVNGIACLVVLTLIHFDEHAFPRRFLAYVLTTVLVPPLFGVSFWLCGVPPPFTDALSVHPSVVAITCYSVAAGIVGLGGVRCTTPRPGNVIFATIVGAALVGSVSLTTVVSLVALLSLFTLQRDSNVERRHPLEILRSPVAIITVSTTILAAVHISRGSVLF